MGRSLLMLTGLSLFLVACDSVTPLTKGAIHSLHASYNNTDFSKIYSDLDPEYKTKISEETFISSLSKRKKEIGRAIKVDSILMLTPIYTTNTIIFVRQRTQFEKTNCVETITLNLDNKNLRILDYNCSY